MSLKRRGFLGGVAAAFATTPDKVLRASGISTGDANIGRIGPGGFSSSAREPVSTIYNYNNPDRTWAVTRKLELQALHAAMPEWFEKRRRKAAKNVHVLDPNIDALVSVSKIGKINMQMELQYRRNLIEELESLDITIAQDEWSF
jgi:hypothetical protein